ncbi:diguanylate cyclase/phosphodiesterase (GGDEF & EAL domains) with PAS/PAC sensor(s) [hydrothermal vent metagenome]|uniref:Diguanylate cyclase/phosphodiesterase (GGDEF & EAL domains) with PAS/PAC sensor(S) n=1 Tax=hydrothermal vent metagenome TaxID=652676 RepID=A0A3B0WI76_9ZZZZ
MGRFSKSYLVFIPLLMVTLVSSGCVFDLESDSGSDSDFKRLIENIFSDKDGESVPLSTSKEYANYKRVTNAESLIESSNTSTISIGVLDDGFNTNHIELADRMVVKQNYDDVAINNAIVNGVYGDQRIAWEWADHGTGVIGLALGKSLGMAPQAEAVTSLNRSLDSFFDADEYFQSFNKDTAGRFLDAESNEQICVQHIYQDKTMSLKQRWFPWCVNFSMYHIDKIAQLASYDMPAVNLSSTITFGHYQTGIDLSFNQTKWDNKSYQADWDKANLPEFNELSSYDYNVSYNYIRDLLSTGELVIVLAAGNDNLSLTQRQVLEWQNLKNTSSDPLAQTIVNIFFDPDIDSNGNAIIEDSERGITKGMLFVGALEETGAFAWYSNYPGSSPEVQARFIVAPGDLTIATPSLGEGAYSLVTGTSNAAPIVTGAMALLKVNHPAKTAREIADAILATASKEIPKYDVEKHGQGLLDVAAADAYLNAN